MQPDHTQQASHLRRGPQLPLKIEEFYVKGLFKCLDHKIPFHQDGTTFIHGPNGCGKTTVLRLLHGILSLNLESVKKIEFESLHIKFNDDINLNIIRKIKSIDKILPEQSSFSEEEEEDVNLTEISFDLSETNGAKNLKTAEYIFGNEENEELAQAIRRNPLIVTKYLPNLIQIGPRNWREKDSSRVINFNAIVNRYAASFPYSIPQWFRDRVKRVSLGLIKTQRLIEIAPETPENIFDNDSRPFRDVVGRYAEELKRLIAETIEVSALTSQSKERSFPQRILAGEYQPIKDAELRVLYLRLQQRLTNLAANGLQESSTDATLPIKKLNPTERRVLSLYLSDLNNKLDTFSDLQSKIELLKSLFGSKIRRKTFQINRADGFSITDSMNQKPLKPEDLSSGEQHQLVMLYELIFSAQGNQLFLIDEPEISLHVEWQRQFLDDLTQVALLRGHSFLIATHSPQIINSRIDLAIPLDGGIAE